MSLHPHLSEEKFETMLNVAINHAQIYPASRPSLLEHIRARVLGLHKSKMLAVITACVLILMVSIPRIIIDPQYTAGEESLSMMSAIVSYDSLNQLGG